MTSSTIVFILVTLRVFTTSVSATEYTVGDESGWTLDFDYQTWAKDKVFVVGDKLVFNYASGTHNVVKVNGTGFQQCTTSSATANGTLTTGEDIISLKTPGRKWYICGVAKHCELRNMKLVINVLPQTMAPAPSQSASTTLAVIPTMYHVLVVALFASLVSFLV